MAPPNRWNWKTAVVSFAAGMLATRLVKAELRRIERPGKGSLAGNPETEALDEARHAEQEVRHAVLTLLGVGMAAAQDLGNPLTGKDLEEALTTDKMDALARRSLERATQHSGGLPPGLTRSMAEGLMVRIARSLRTLIVRIVTEGVLPVPERLDPQIYAAIPSLLEEAFRKVHDRSPDSFAEMARRAGTLDELLARWRREGKPEPYTRVLLETIHALRKVELATTG